MQRSVQQGRLKRQRGQRAAERQRGASALNMADSATQKLQQQQIQISNSKKGAVPSFSLSLSFLPLSIFWAEWGIVEEGKAGSGESREGELGRVGERATDLDFGLFGMGIGQGVVGDIAQWIALGRIVEPLDIVRIGSGQLRVLAANVHL